jgi:hypothetical protein
VANCSNKWIGRTNKFENLKIIYLNNEHERASNYPMAVLPSWQYLRFRFVIYTAYMGLM